MRASVVAVAAMGLAMSGCASGVPLLGGKPSPRSMSRTASMPTRPSCPAMRNEEWKPVVDAAVHKTFDRQLQKRFGDTSVHTRIAWSKDDKGRTVITAQRVGPAKYAMPEPGKGGEVEVVFQPCTGKVLKTRKVANLERKPQPLSDSVREGFAAPRDSAPSTPRKRGFKWPWKS